MTHLLIGSGLVNPSKPILNSLLQNNPPAQIVQSLFKSVEKDAVFSSSKSLVVLDSVLRWYCEKRLCFQALEAFNLARHLVKTEYSDGNELFSIGLYNTVLNALQENNEVKLGLCFYAVMIRHGVLIDRFTWRIVAKIFSKEGKVDAILRIIDMGMDDPLIYDSLIECCSEIGMFKVALHMLDEMSKRKLNPGFSTCVSILNGACRYKNDEVIKFAMESMAEKGYVSKPLREHNSLIRKLCEMKKAYAADMLFKKACVMQISLKTETYGFMLRALSMEGRVKKSIETYQIIEHKGVQMNPIFYLDFINILCNEDPSKDLNSLLIDMISRGFKPSPSALSKYITSQCKKHRWKEAEELADLALQKSILLEASCCGSLVKHYCKRARIDLAINLHDQIAKKELTLDSRTYNALLSGLLEVPRVEEAERIFDYMRIKNLLSSESYVIMINGFSRENELKKAMKLHDEMLELGLKPIAKTYKRLISNFG
ncbi:pentatricopeptide repeat-containing protein At4g21170 [Cynara cardunculus var. scolymus]|uniref:pentatricopeptide repeat-containing protein At4g21170 n=1 Tax=Cynara cardunculus var. scolymus TaxID=59895 RepID=UPI000D62D7CC|nr:pentatricopeptide repeat-containing protein At4g21170 [Cynara cardunculus var. scolymus]